MAEHLPQPNTDSEVYLAAVVRRLDRVLSVLDPQGKTLPQTEQPAEPQQPEAAKPAARRRATKTR